jgi:hypothetical protein
MRTRTPLWLARAKICWGHPLAEVRAYLLAQGFSPEQTEAYLAHFTRERFAAVRRAGLRKIIIGSTIALVCGLLLYAAFSALAGGAASSRRGSGGLGVIVVIGFYGLWLLIDGLIYLFRPGAETLCLTKIDDDFPRL